jgi:hypothetical protein
VGAATEPGINRLVAFIVERFGLPLEIGRQWHVAVFFEIGGFVELHDALTAGQDIDNFRSCSGDFHACAGAEFAAGPDEALPARATEVLEQENFDPRRICEQAGLDDARVIEGDNIPFADIRGEVSEASVFDPAACAVKHKHAGLVAPRGRRGCDQLRRQVVVVVAYVARHVVRTFS